MPTEKAWHGNWHGNYRDWTHCGDHYICTETTRYDDIKFGDKIVVICHGMNNFETKPYRPLMGEV